MRRITKEIRYVFYTNLILLILEIIALIHDVYAFRFGLFEWYTITGSLPVLEAAMPHATVVGFTRPSEVIEYAKANRIALAFLDIEMGKTNGMELCRTLLDINPHTNVVYLTAYSDYAFDA